MQPKIQNELGTITIQNEVIARIAGLAAMECPGVVGMATKSLRDGLVHLLKIESLSKGVGIVAAESGELTVSLHIMVKYGTNIAAIATSLQSNVSHAVRSATGLPVKEVKIFIEGVRAD
jgi:uncharacterized alkaline shock family protein YloU